MTPEPLPEGNLTTEQRGELEEAHASLRAAVANYEKYLGGGNESDEPIPVSDVAAAQEAIESAERGLWRLREKYLGWQRPSWAPSASQETDWFSQEDEVYDVVGSPASDL